MARSTAHLTNVPAVPLWSTPGFADDCTFCNEFAGDVERSHFFHVLGGELRTRTLLAQGRFRVVPSVGPLAVGHLLVLPVGHELSFGAFKGAEAEDAHAVVDRAVAAVRRRYGAAVVFEHGSARLDRTAGCCVVHAHVHVVPADAELAALLADRLGAAQGVGLAQARELHRQEREYILAGSGLHDAAVFAADIIPSQLVRQLLAIRIGHLERWDWRRDPGADRMRQTLADLAGRI